MGVTSIEYSALSALEAAIQAVDRPGDFCVQGRLAAHLPRLEVEGVGTISFPVPAEQVRELLRIADPAPYGRGAETVLDRSVRDSWQIDAANFTLGGRGWKSTFGEILDRVSEGLGCPRDRLEAKPYKLLIYEPGGFFAEHRDTEKAAGMVGTLVLSLPAAGSGGELVVRHKAAEQVIDLIVTDPAELAFAAFYADCRHETRPVLEGHRVSLVFNLLLRGKGQALGSAPDFAEQAAAIARELEEWCRDDCGTNKIVWLLDHDYSDAGLDFAALKGIDAAVARALGDAALRSGCALHAATLHIEECGMPADYDGESYGYGWRSADDLDDPPEMGEIFDSEHWLEAWVAPDGAKPDFGEIPLLDCELLPAGSLDGAEPDSHWVQEASGNEGVELEYAYHRAALVLMPQAKLIKGLAAAGIDAAIKYAAMEARKRVSPGPQPDDLGRADIAARRMKHEPPDSRERVGDVPSARRRAPKPRPRPPEPMAVDVPPGRWMDREDESASAKGPQGSGAPRTDAGTAGAESRSIEFAAGLIDAWPSPNRSSGEEAERSHCLMLRFLGPVRDEATTKRFLDEVLADRYQGGENKDLLAAAACLGSASMRDFLPGFVARHLPERANSVLPLAWQFRQKSLETRGDSWREALEGAGRVLFEVLPTALQGFADRNAAARARDQFEGLGAEALQALFRLGWSLDLREEADAAARLLAGHPGVAAPDRALPDALAALHPHGSGTQAFASLWGHAAQYLLRRSSEQPERPKNWAIAADIECDCEQCQALAAFCRDPAARTGRFPLRQDLRQHLRESIAWNRLDLMFHTERRGRPYTLVCEKTGGAYKRRLKQYAADVERMRALANAPPDGPEAAECADGLARAIEAAA